MKNLFIHDLNNSFILWFDSFLTRKGEAYKTYTTKLYNYTDYRLGGGKIAYGSPYKQWVYDRSVTGATFATGFLIDGVLTPTGTSGMFIDYDNGRIVFNSGVSTSLNITGTYSVKDINVYQNDIPEEQLIIEGKYITNSRYTVTSNYVEPYKPAAPSAFCSVETIDNQPFAFGGEDCSKIQAKAVVFCESLYQLDGVISIFADSKQTNFSKISATGNPIGEFGKLKTGVFVTGYNYIDLSTSYGPPTIYVAGTTISKVRDDSAKELNPNLHIGIIDFNLETVRTPRA